MLEEWTEKYRPKSLSQIVGNEAAVRALRRWGESWEHGTPRFKAITLRGEPGTGKTSAALALANDMGWDFIEMNASDHRNAASIKKVAGAGSVTHAFSASGEFLSAAEGRRKLIVLDEADNLFGREDYGGAKAIVETIRESSQPIILIVNDYYELSRKAPAIKTLSDKAVFRRLDGRSVASVLRSIVQKEGILVDDAVIQRIAVNSGGDMRAAVNDIQMMAEGKSALGEADSTAMGERNRLKEMDAALRGMFGATSLKDARAATFDLDETPDDLIKWIEENIPQELRNPAEMAAAFDALARSDIYLGRTRALQHYGLWSYAKELMTGGVALARERPQRPATVEYRFPGHFILMSRARGPRAARDSVAGKLRAHLHTSKKCISESTLPLLATLVKNDRELLVSLASEQGFDDGDVAFLLGEDTDSRAVKDVMDEVKRSKAADDVDEGARGQQRASRGKKDLSRFR